MNWQTFLSIAAASCGFASAIWFAAGSTLMKAKQIEKIANPAWKSARDSAFAIASQVAQYSIGALLLLVSFGLQVAAVRASTAKVPMPHPVLEDTAALSGAIAVLALALPWPIYAWRNARLREQLKHLPSADQT